MRLAQRRWYKENKQTVKFKLIEQKYGLSKDEYINKLSKQEFVCGICKTKTDKFFVDHNHKTGKTRGILCHHCNLMLGMSRDTPEILESGARYLKEYYED